MTLEKGIQLLENLMERAIKEKAFPGISYAIVTRKQKLFGQLGDKAWIPKRESLTERTVYDLASLSKVVSTTTLILLLMERGELSLFDSISYYLPDFKHSGITIYHLLTHTSGLPEDIPRAYTLQTPDEVIQKVYQQELIHPIGETIVYSDIGYILLGFIIEKISGKPISELAEELIFQPLNMVDTTYAPTDINRCAPTELREDDVYQGVLRGIVHDEKAYALRGNAGHAGVFSTVNDLANFIKMILEDGEFEGQPFLSKATIDLLFQPHVERAEASHLPYRRSLGWEYKSPGLSVGDLVGEHTIFHTGFTGTNMVIDRDHGIGMVFLTNHVHPKRGKTKLFRYRTIFSNVVLSKIYPYMLDQQ